MKVFTIYKATNKVNGKNYIGFDSNWPNRIALHTTNKKRKENHIFHRAIQKYGKGAFTWEPIYQTLDGQHCLNVMEEYFIKEYNSFYLWENGGYNMTLGGEGTVGFKFTEEQKKNISNGTKQGMKKWWASLSEEQKEDYIKRCQKRPEGFKYKEGHGVHVVSEEARKKIGLTHLGKPKSEEHKKKLSLARTGKCTGSRNGMANPETREKHRLACIGRKRVNREDGTWYWSKA